MTYKSRVYEFSHVKGYFKIQIHTDGLLFKIYGWDKKDFVNKIFKTTNHYQYFYENLSSRYYSRDTNKVGINWGEKTTDPIEKISKIKYHCVKALEFYNEKYVKKQELEIAAKEESNIMIEALKDL